MHQRQAMQRQRQFYGQVAKGGPEADARIVRSRGGSSGGGRLRTKPTILDWFCEYPKDTHKSVTVFKTVAKLQPDNFGSQAEPPGQ